MTTVLQSPAGASRQDAFEENPPGGPLHNVPLGTLVYRAGLMPLDELESALREAVHDGRRLGEVLVERGLEERDLVRLLAAQHAQPFVALDSFEIDVDVARSLAPSVARSYCALPFARMGPSILVAVPDSAETRHVDRLSAALRHPVRLVTAVREDIKSAIDTLPSAETPAASARSTHAAAGRLATESIAAQYEVAVTLSTGRDVIVGRATTRAGAEALAERVAEQAQAGGRITTGDSIIDGAAVVSVEVLHATAEVG